MRFYFPCAQGEVNVGYAEVFVNQHKSSSPHEHLPAKFGISNVASAWQHLSRVEIVPEKWPGELCWLPYPKSPDQNLTQGGSSANLATLLAVVHCVRPFSSERFGGASHIWATGILAGRPPNPIWLEKVANLATKINEFLDFCKSIVPKDNFAMFLAPKTNAIEISEFLKKHRGVNIDEYDFNFNLLISPLTRPTILWIPDSGVEDFIRWVLHPQIIENALKTSKELISQKIKECSGQISNAWVDSWGVAFFKSQLHALSEAVAEEAVEAAKLAAAIYTYDVFIMWVPLICELRWKRGYMSGLQKILNMPEPKMHIGNFECREASPPCLVVDGVLSAEQDSSGQVLIKLDGHPATLVCNLTSSNIEAILDSVNHYGRLGVPRTGGLSLYQRIKEVPVRIRVGRHDELAAALFRNRQALIPLIARLKRMPGYDWLLPAEGEFPKIGVSLLPDMSVERLKQGININSDDNLVEEVFLARQAVQEQTGRKISLEELRELREILKSEEVRAIFGDLVDRDPDQVLRTIIGNFTRH